MAGDKFPCAKGGPAVGVVAGVHTNHNSTAIVAERGCPACIGTDVITLNHVIVGIYSKDNDPASIISGDYISRARRASSNQIVVGVDPDAVARISQISSSGKICADKVTLNDILRGVVSNAHAVAF